MTHHLEFLQIASHYIQSLTEYTNYNSLFLVEVDFLWNRTVESTVLFQRKSTSTIITTEWENYIRLFLIIIKEMYETKNHSFHQIQELMSRYLTNSTSDENNLNRWITHQTAEGKKKQKKKKITCGCMWNHRKNISIRWLQIKKMSLTTMYNFCSAHWAWTYYKIILVIFI